MGGHAKTVNRSGNHSELGREDHWNGSNSSSSSSSSSSISSHLVVESEKYDVFVNHRGPDTKNQFVTHLEDALNSNKISAFVDKSVEEGAHAFDAIDLAIQTAPIQLAIFSRDYASSSFCLDELVAMLARTEKERPHVKFLPVFFDVEPRYLKGDHLFGEPFHKAFQKHESNPRYTDEHISRWKKALHDAAKFKGFVLSNLGNDTNKLKKKIVARVQEILRATNSGRSPPKDQVEPDPVIGQLPQEIIFTPTDRPLRVLVLGDVDSVERVVSRICGTGMRHTQLENHEHLTESRSSSPPMWLYYCRTKGSDKEQFDNVIKAFIDDRNSRSRSKQVVDLCLDVIHHRRRLADLQNLLPRSASRLHAVWYVCREMRNLPDKFLWKDIMATLSNIPLQVVVTTAPGYKKILEEAIGYFPKAQEPELQELVVEFEGDVTDVEKLSRICWQAKTRAEIRNVAKVIREVRKELGKAGVKIRSAGVGNPAIPAKHSNSLPLGGQFLRQFFCEYWEIPSIFHIDGILRETTSFIERTPEGKHQYAIQSGQFVTFCLQVAAVILYIARDDDDKPRYECDWPNSEVMRPGIRGCYDRYFQRPDRTYDRMKAGEIQAFLQSIFERREFNFDHPGESRQKSCFPFFKL